MLVPTVVIVAMVAMVAMVLAMVAMASDGGSDDHLLGCPPAWSVDVFALAHLLLLSPSPHLSYSRCA